MILTKFFRILNVIRTKVIRISLLSGVFLLLLQCDYLEEKRLQEYAECRAALESEASVLNLSNDEKLWFYAAILDSVGVAEMLPLSSNPGMEFYIYPETHSPLTISLEMYRPNDVAKMLVEHGVPLTSGTCRPEISALHRASRLGKTEVVEVLLRKGVQVNSFSYSESIRAMDDDAYTPLMLACDSYATIRQHKEILESPWALETMLLQHGADINASTPEHQRTALHHAIFNSNADPLFIKFLCESGADVNAQDKWGMTPYMYCCLHDKIILAAVLQGYGVNLSLRNVYGYTADEISCMHRGSDFPEGASAAFQSFVKLRRLCSQTEGFDTSAANQILPHLPDINTPDATGRTLLSIAVDQRNVEAVRWLLSKGANPNASSGGFYTKAESIMELACNCDDKIEARTASTLSQLSHIGNGKGGLRCLGNFYLLSLLGNYRPVSPDILGKAILRLLKVGPRPQHHLLFKAVPLPPYGNGIVPGLEILAGAGRMPIHRKKYVAFEDIGVIGRTLLHDSEHFTRLGHSQSLLHVLRRRPGEQACMTALIAFHSEHSGIFEDISAGILHAVMLHGNMYPRRPQFGSELLQIGLMPIGNADELGTPHRVIALDEHCLGQLRFAGK